MAAPKGNQFWKIRSTHGRSKLFENPELLWETACEYFQWVDKHPLKKSVVCSFGGKNVLKSVPLMRAMTVSGLCIYFGASEQFLTNFESTLDLKTDEGKDFSGVIENIREIIKTQKFEGACAGQLNANIIARDLGLADTQLLTGTGKDGAIKTETTTFNFIPVGPND